MTFPSLTLSQPRSYSRAETFRARSMPCVLALQRAQGGALGALSRGGSNATGPPATGALNAPVSVLSPNHSPKVNSSVLGLADAVTVDSL